jgi:NADH-quinone oxidoreductase subunit J
VIVYAGAIIVTFLFVIMLAQMEGRAPYDRAARAPGGATFSCYLLLWGLLYALLVVRSASPPPSQLENIKRDYGVDAQKAPGTARLLAVSARGTLRLRADDGNMKSHVAGLGESLYTDHLISAELAGTLLFAALIGALAIAAPKPPVRPGDGRPQPLTNA